MIDLSMASRSFSDGVDTIQAFRDVSFSVGKGGFVALVGPSGCGKTTLLRCIAGLDSVTEGVISVHGKPPVVARGDGSVAISAQVPVLLPWRSIYDNVALPLEVRKTQMGLHPTAAIHRVGLEAFARRYPHELSGGMRQRAAFARAMVWAPRLLLLDEPFSALDDQSRMTMNDELRHFCGERGITVVLVTHSLVEAVYCAEQVVVFSPRPGRVERAVTVDLPRERTAEHRRSTSFKRALAEVREAVQ